jgi:hypothetical protein
MTNFTYTRDIPDAPNNPSNDQGPMKVNTNSIDDLIDEDHYSFGVANGGLHRQVRLVNLTGIPIGLMAGIGTLYTKLATSTGVSTESNLFFTPSASGNQYQLTRPITGSFASFSQLGAFGTITATWTMVAGWTFLPGGMLFQYGSANRPAGVTSTAVVVTFPVPFSTSDVVVSITPISKAGGTGNNNSASLIDTTLSASGFSVNFTSSTSAYVGFTWTAIGK